MCSKLIPAGTNKAETISNSSASKQMDAPKNGTSKGSLDLSAELRNYVYELILTSDWEIHMMRDRLNENRWRGWRIRMNQVAAVRGTSLLCTNRQVHAETKPILYGGNTFVVSAGEGLECFSSKVLPYIRKIRFDGAWSRLTKPLAELESKAAKLEVLESLTFTVRSELVIGSMRAERAAKKLMPLLTAFTIARQLEVKDTIALVSFTAESDHPSAALPPSEGMIAIAAQCTDGFRKKAQELLERARWRSEVGFDELSGSIR